MLKRKHYPKKLFYVSLSTLHKACGTTLHNIWPFTFKGPYLICPRGTERNMDCPKGPKKVKENTPNIGHFVHTNLSPGESKQFLVIASFYMDTKYSLQIKYFNGPFPPKYPPKT